MVGSGLSRHTGGDQRFTLRSPRDRVKAMSGVTKALVKASDLRIVAAKESGKIMKTAEIVLIEDNPGDVFLVEMALQANQVPYHLTRFETGEDALGALSTTASGHDFRPDAILLDLNTPKSDGFEVLGRLRRNPNLVDVPIAIITSSRARNDKHRTSLMGAVRYIEKPSDLERFLSTVGTAVKEMLHA